MFSLRFADGCVFQDKIEKYHIEMNQQIIVEPLFWLETEEPIVPMQNTGHFAWESCKLVKEHVLKYCKYGACDFAEMYLHDSEKRISDDAWYLHRITWEEGKIKYLYGSSRIQDGPVA